MGNEASFHIREDEDTLKKGGRILRSSSLKSQLRPDYTRQRGNRKEERPGEEVESEKNKMPTSSSSSSSSSSIRSRFSLKRSNTFTSFNTFKKPLFLSKLASNMDDKRTANKIETAQSEEAGKQIEQKDGDVITEYKKDVKVDRIVEEKLFVPRKENHKNLEKEDDNSSLVIIRERESEEMREAMNPRRVVSTLSRITLKVNKPDEENKSNKITKDEKKTTSVFLSNTKEDSQTVNDSCSVDSKENNTCSSTVEDTHSNHSSIFEENFEKNMDEKFSTPDSSEGEEDTRRHSFTPAERRKKNVLRSQSMNYHMIRPKLSTEHHRSASIDEGIDGIAATKINLERSESQKIGLGSRRRSDTSLLKEQHVKRSEQFTQMLKQYRQQNENKAKLSSYGLGVIAENASKGQPQITRSTKLRRKNDYIDSWLKDQSDRINNLSVAAKGDAENMRSLRASFRERSLKTAQKDLLPKRPSSVKLPRRNQNTSAFVSSSDSEDLDFDMSKMKLVDKNGNFISSRTQTKNPLKKQLTDTLLLVDKSFKNSALASSDGSPCIRLQQQQQQPQQQQQQQMSTPTVTTSPSKTNGSIRFCSTPTSSVVARASNIAVVKPMKRESKENVLQVNTVKRLDERPLIEKDLSTSLQSYKDPLGPKANDKELIKQEEKRRRVFIRSSSFDNKPQMVSHSTITRTKSDSVNRLSDSLNKVMGDLKTLRSQDISLAEQLLGLGKSIQDFKEERYLPTTKESECLI